ncbi:MAG: histidine phosphatase family protein, partial [Pseudomonadota bacterium]
YILRHGETAWNREGRMQGRLDSPLTEVGQAQARKQREILASRLPQTCAVFASPAGRARQTAEIACASLGPVAILEDLAELHMGKWQGLSQSEIAATDAGRAALEEGAFWKFHAPEGESLDTLFERTRRVLARLEGPSVLVTHGVTSVALRLLARGDDIDRFEHLDDPQGVVFAIENHREEIWR